MDGAGADRGRRQFGSPSSSSGSTARGYVVFEFWEKRLHGTFSGSFGPGPIPARFNSQVFVIRERLLRPQLIATSRHVTGGGVDLVGLSWDGSQLAGRSRIVAGDPYSIYVTVPAGFTIERAVCDATRVDAPALDGVLARFTCRSETSGNRLERVVPQEVRLASSQAGHQADHC